MKRTKDKINILFAGRYSEGEILSGPEVAAKSIFEEHCLDNSSVFIQYFFDGRKYSIFKKLFGRETADIKNSKVLTLGLFRIIPELLRRRPDVIHLITFERFEVIFFIYRLLFRVKIIYNSHGIIQHENSELKKLPFFYRFKDKFCERIYLKCSDKTIFPSEIAMDMVNKYYKLDERTCVILPNGVSEMFFKVKTNPQRTEKLKAVMHYKNELNYSGFELLQRAMSSIAISLDIYILTNIEITLPQTGKITFYINKMMPSENLSEFYADKDVFLSLNKYDTFSIAAGEAMASGLIPVVTTQTGISRYIQNGVNGFAFDHFDISGLTEILNTLDALEKQKKYKLSSAAVRTAEELKWSYVYKMYFELYREITE